MAFFKSIDRRLSRVLDFVVWRGRLPFFAFCCVVLAGCWGDQRSFQTQPMVLDSSQRPVNYAERSGGYDKLDAVEYNSQDSRRYPSSDSARTYSDQRSISPGREYNGRSAGSVEISAENFEPGVDIYDPSGVPSYGRANHDEEYDTGYGSATVADNRSSGERPLYVYDPSNRQANEHGYVVVGEPLPPDRSAPAVGRYEDRPYNSSRYADSPDRQVYNRSIEPQRPLPPPPMVTNVRVSEIGPAPRSLEDIPVERHSLGRDDYRNGLDGRGDLNQTVAKRDLNLNVNVSAIPTAGPIVDSSIPAVNVISAIEPPSPSALPVQPPGGVVLQDAPGRQIADLIADLERYVTEDADNIDAQLALRCLYSVRGDAEKAFDPLDQISLAQQQDAIALGKAMLLVAQVRSLGDHADVEQANKAYKSLKQLQEKVAEKADLQISSLAICSKVDGFGRYDRIFDGKLELGYPMRVIVYCELDNFKNTEDADGKYLTDLHARITLYDQDYNILRQQSADVRDIPSFRPRRDFFLRGPLDMPKLSPGKYQIEVRIEDKIAGKVARPARYEFEVKPLSRPSEPQ